MCDFCEQGKHLKTVNKEYEANASLAWENGRWGIVVKTKYEVGAIWMKMDTTISVGFCPMCGRELSKRGE